MAVAEDGQRLFVAEAAVWENQLLERQVAQHWRYSPPHTHTHVVA